MIVKIFGFGFRCWGDWPFIFRKAVKIRVFVNEADSESINFNIEINFLFLYS